MLLSMQLLCYCIIGDDAVSVVLVLVLVIFINSSSTHILSQSYQLLQMEYGLLLTFMF